MTTKKEDMEFREKLLDEYENNVGLPPNIAPGNESELQEYLTMDRDVIEKMSADRCLSTSIRLNQYAIYITRLSNREKARKIWAKDELDKIVAVAIGDYDKYTKSEYKAALAIRENVAAKALSDILIYASQRVTRLEELSSSISSLAYVISLAYKQKVSEHR